MDSYKLIRRGIALIMLAVITPAFAQPASQTVTDEQKAKLEQIDKYIEQQRQNVTYDYSIWLDEIRANKANEVRRLETINPELFVRGGFVGWANYVANSLDLQGINLMNDPQFAETFKNLHNGGGGLTAVEKFDLTPRLLAIAEDRFATHENRALRGYDAAELRLLRDRDYALNVQLPQLAEQLKNNVLNPPKPKPAGLVSGIVYSGNKSAAIVGSKIVRSGETIGSVKIVKINRDSVEFSKNGQTWTQKTGEAPSSVWQ